MFHSFHFKKIKHKLELRLVSLNKILALRHTRTKDEIVKVIDLPI